MMRARYLVFCVFAACSTTPSAGDTVSPARLSSEVADSTYGYTESNPINVGGHKEEMGAHRQREYLSALRGPEGQPVRFERKGSCCQFATPNGFMARVSSTSTR